VKGYSLPEHLQYTGHNDASILLDINEINLEECPPKLLDDTPRNLIRMGDNQQGLTVIPRMCLRKIKSKFRQAVTFHALLQILAHLTPEVTLMCHVCS
jgi:hypothetical protein